MGLSRWLHRWVGLALVAYLGWMGGSGVLLNHPGLISGISVPEWMVPPQYRIADWSRGALRSLMPVEGREGRFVAAGRLGVWLSDDGGRSFVELNEGLGSLYRRNAQQVLSLTGDSGPVLLAATRGGLFQREEDDAAWRRVPLGDKRPVVKVVGVGDRLLAFTDSGVFASPAPPADLEFAPITLTRASTASEVSMIDALFALHSGEAWGLPGQLVYDLVGVVLVILSFSALVTWLYRKVRHRLGRVRSRIRGAVRGLVRYHLDLGIWSAVFLLVIGVSGMFMRPPLLVLAAGETIPRWVYPGLTPRNPWHHRIQNATYDEAGERLLIQANDGVWEGPPNLDGTFRRVILPAPIFAMGATVFEAREDGSLDVGSFAGLYRVDAAQKTTDLLATGLAEGRSRMRPGRHLVTGFVRLPTGESVVNTHRQGVLDLNGAGAGDRLPMPDLEGASAGMPLWNFLFELHNGRIFRDLIGPSYVFVVPLGGFLLVLLTLTGVWDWMVPKWRQWRRARAGG